MSETLFCIDKVCKDLWINALIDYYKSLLYEYNNTIKNYGLYLKPVHIVVKKVGHKKQTYLYYGKYWYRIEKIGSKIRWIYLGSSKPRSDIPDPPKNPLSIIVFEDVGDRICIKLSDETKSIKPLVRSLNEILKHVELYLSTSGRSV